MIRNLCFALCLLAIAGTSAAAGLEIIEEALELTADQVNLPFSESGTLGVRRCAECVPERLSLGVDTEFLIGRDRVTLAELRNASAASSAFYVFYDAKDGHVTRIVLRAPRGPTARSRK